MNDTPTNPTREAQPSATPRTDVECPVTICDRNGNEYEADLVSASFARTLETELQQANARERDLKDEMAKRDAELADLRQAEQIQRRSADEQMRYKREAEAELARLKAGSGRADQYAEQLEQYASRLGRDQWLLIAAHLLRAQQAENASLKHEKEAAEDWSKSLSQLLANAQAENARLAAETSAFCEWSYNEDYSYFDGMCGAAWYFEHVSEDEVPSKTLRFCPSCGKQIKRVERTRAAGPAVAGGGRENT